MFSTRRANNITIILQFCLLLFFTADTQNISGIECFNSTNGQYLCNGQGYQGFSTSTSFNTNTVMCIGGVNACWYQINSTIPNVNQYVFCNYTFASCSTCSGNLSCLTCYNGYYTFVYEILQGYSICQSCSQAIPGCEICESQVGCSQCASPYVNYFGQCYTQKGKPVGGFDPFNLQESSSSIPQIITAALVFIIFVTIVIVSICLLKRKKDYSYSDALYYRHENINTGRNSQMKESHQMRQDSTNRNMINKTNGH